MRWQSKVEGQNPSYTSTDYIRVSTLQPTPDASWWVAQSKLKFRSNTCGTPGGLPFAILNVEKGQSTIPIAQTQTHTQGAGMSCLGEKDESVSHALPHSIPLWILGLLGDASTHVRAVRPPSCGYSEHYIWLNQHTGFLCCDSDIHAP